MSGTLTTALGAIDSARIGFVQDATGGIAIRLDAALATPLAAGSAVEVTGSLGSYFSLRTLNAASSGIVLAGATGLPPAAGTATGTATEALEGTRILVSGTVTETPAVLADGLGVTIDDGSGALRLIVSADALAGAAPATGDLGTAIGPLGQRDSSGTGLAGYRLHSTLVGEFTIAAPPTPSPTPPPSPTPSATPTPTPLPSGTPEPTPAPLPTPTPTPTATPSPSPTPTPAPALAIADARRQAVGAVVSVTGVVTAEAGRLGTPPLIAIQDSSGGIVVRLPDGVSGPARGARVEVHGPLADPYGQLEVRPTTTGFRVSGTGVLPDPTSADAGSLGEGTEGQLVAITGIVDGRPTKATSGDITFYLEVSAGQVRIVADASSRLTPDSMVVGATYRVIGVAGQRASRKGALDGYRVWPRDAADLTLIAAPSATPGPSGSAGPTPDASNGGDISIADAIRRGEGSVTVTGLVTTTANLLDATGRRIVIEDRSAGIEVLIPTDAHAPAVGTRIRVTGTVGRAYDAPRLRAEGITVVAIGARPLALDLQHAPTAAQEWRLVRVRGVVAEVHKLGDRWRAELSVAGERIVISGLAGARIPASTLVEGRTATVVGIARRPYPGATDRRWSVAPRSSADVVISAASSSGGPDGLATASTGAAGSDAGTGSTTPSIDLVDAADHPGQVVRVGGLITELAPDGFLLDDGTAVGRVTLTGDAADYLPLLEAGDAVNATGTVVADESGARIVVDDPAGLVRVGDPTADGLEAVGLPNLRNSGPEADGSATRGRLAGGLLGLDGPGAAGLLGVVLVSVASLAVSLLRRQRARRLFAARVAARLAAIGRPTPAES
ncbi:MAG TPA: hypothetical protein VGQ64_06440 [Candidatus Limnocylindrales bacterium]|nr:hypothetical protein [Candidatus Limnocylindrales bacterium]